MKRQVRKAGMTFMILLCIGTSFGCASGQRAAENIEGQESEQGSIPEERQESGEISSQELTGEEFSEELPWESEDGISEGEEYSPKEQIKKNEEKFFEEAGKQGIDQQIADTYLQILTDDNIFQDGAMALTGFRIADIDGNGQADMLVMVLDAKETPFYGSGSLWFYMNEDAPYCFSEEDCSYYGWFDTFWDDIDNDENVEIVFSAQGTGCGAVGDSYKAVFKYKDHSIERMQMPSDFEEDYDCGLLVEVFQEPETDGYSAYCPYFDETICFNVQDGEKLKFPNTDTTESVGGNARGFYNLCVAEYQGRKALQASEYLYGGGGVVNYVATAQFLITWNEDGTPEVVTWWIEE